MTDQIPADKVREIIARWRDGVSDRGGLILDDLKALLSAPPRPTLADMTEEERAACKWMQADVESEGRAIILQPNASVGRALMLDPEANLVYAERDRVIPRPDLPRLEWPGDTPTGPNHLAVGTVIESADDPRIAALPDGSILLDCDGETVAKQSGAWRGDGYLPVPPEGAEFGPWTVLHIPKETDQ